MHVCMCAHVHRYTSTCVCGLVRPDDSLRTCHLGTLSIFDWDRPLIGLKLPVRLDYDSVSTFPGLGFQVHSTMPGFLCRYWGSDSGPYVLGSVCTGVRLRSVGSGGEPWVWGQTQVHRYWGKTRVCRSWGVRLRSSCLRGKQFID